jgi:hypothetical protein
MMDAIRSQARQAIAANAAALDRTFGAGQPLGERAKRWWDLPAKLELGHRIAREELAASVAAAEATGTRAAHNNAYDAMRHARWSERMAQEIGPSFAALAGLEHELENTLQGQGRAEALMDLRNNAEGRRAAADHRPIDPRNLQTGLSQPAPAGNPAYAPAAPPMRW